MANGNWVDDICTRCWGAQTVVSNAGDRVQCPRCKGTGEEPDTPAWWAVLFIVIVLIVFLFAQWSIPN